MRAGAAACAAVVLLGAVAWLPPKAAQRGLLLARHPAASASSRSRTRRRFERARACSDWTQCKKVARLRS